MTGTVELHHKTVGDAGGGDVAGPEINRAREVASGIDVAGTIHRHPMADIQAAGAAVGGGPLMGTSSVEFGDKHVHAVVVGGDVPGPEINCDCEDAGDIDVAGTIHRHPKAEIGGDAGAAEGGGPLM
ncbi:MAG: hypothetical protein P8J75_07695, partial [Actinomycetota bacterium]|nr:hypothetical protein [Actinomycetota bacterium]